jgi:O-antigen ligase
MAGYSHNGFFDLLLQEGILGMFAFVTGYLILWRRALAFLSRTTGPAPLWLCTYLIFLLLYNITEGSILEQNNLLWILYVATAVNLFAITYRHAIPRREDEGP